MLMLLLLTPTPFAATAGSPPLLLLLVTWLAIALWEASLSFVVCSSTRDNFACHMHLWARSAKKVMLINKSDVY
jgi:hypothetical protein